MTLNDMLRDTLLGLLRELCDGPPAEMAFVINPNDPGLFRSLAVISAADASARPDGRSSVAAHTQHLRYGFELLNRWARGEDPFADANYAQSWGQQQVTEHEWRELREALDREVRAWMEAIATDREWTPLFLSGFVSSVAHLAYHMGAIRQLARSASGPPARD
jgi:hypothetical protein